MQVDQHSKSICVTHDIRITEKKYKIILNIKKSIYKIQQYLWVTLSKLGIEKEFSSA